MTRGWLALREFWRRCRWLTGRARFHSELAEEMQFHVETRAAELEASGISSSEAMSRARREFGSPLKAAEDTAGAWQVQWLEDLLSDLVYAARAFRRNPGFAATAIVCLALGIGANLTIFNLTTSFLFSEPSCRDSALLISIWEGGSSASSVADYKFLRDARVFDGMAGINIEREVNWREGDRTRRFYAGVVTDDFFHTLGIPMLLGRGIGRGETDTAVLSYRAWRGAFGGDPAILGRRLVLDGRQYTTVGVLPANNRSISGFGFSPEVYVPVVHDDEYVQFYARLPKGMTIGIARARLRPLFDQLDHIYPIPGRRRAVQTRVTGVTGFDVLNQEIPGAVTAFFVLLQIVVALVLLIACANVASLLLARAANRSQELAIRVALGAGRRRIMRHLLAESLLLSGLGALAGIGIDLLCGWSIDRLTLPVPVPIHLVVAPDWRVLCYGIVAVMTSAFLCGLLPAFHAAKQDVNRALKRGERQIAVAWTLRSALIAGQLAVSMVLLAAGFLFLHNLLRATTMNPGFDVHRTLWAYMRLVPEKYADPNQDKQKLVLREALEQLLALPGVESAAVTRGVPLNGNCVIGTRLMTDISLRPIPVEYQCNNVGPDYFRTLGISVLGGREFVAKDTKGGQAVTIVNETFARTVFGGTNPIGHTLRTEFVGDKPKRIIGVVRDSKYFVLGERQRLALYEPYSSAVEPVNLNFLLRTSGSPAPHVKAVTDLLGRLDPTAAIETKPMSQALGLALLPSRAGALLLSAMGLLGLVLAAIGLYGVLLYSVSRRTREIGLRIALGATPRDVLRLVGQHAMGLVGLGSMAGLGLALFAVRPLALFLVPGLSPLDLPVFLAVIGVLGAVALLATLMPAARALRVDPMIALRYE